MTMLRIYVLRGRAIPAAALAALMLAGCSSGHVGEDWQCPLAAGGSCAGVAAADPAVPKADAARPIAAGAPIRLLPRDDAAVSDRTSPGTRSCEADCGFDPFSWLARLFGTDTGGDNARPAATPATTTDVERALDRSVPDGDVDTPAAALPADPAPGDDPADDDLRTGEAVARIWIAPFVDADGVYREASHVRVVLEPAGWRLPR